MSRGEPSQQDRHNQLTEDNTFYLSNQETTGLPALYSSCPLSNERRIRISQETNQLSEGQGSQQLQQEQSHQQPLKNSCQLPQTFQQGCQPLQEQYSKTLQEQRSQASRQRCHHSHGDLTEFDQDQSEELIQDPISQFSKGIMEIIISRSNMCK